MKTELNILVLVTSLLTLTATLRAASLGTVITYQGRLNDGAGLANGNYDLRFRLFDGPIGGVQIGSSIFSSPVAVTEGLFTVPLDFGTIAFDGNARWLEIGVRTNGSKSSHTILSPLQPLTPAPYALYAARAGTATAVSGAVPVSQLTGIVSLQQLPSALVTNGEAGVSISGSFSGNGAGLSSLNAANLTGTLTDARLSANVALRNAANTFNGNQVIAQGRVGIGTTNPAAHLHVVGTVRMNVLEIDGGSDVAEPYQVAAAHEVEPKPGMLVEIDPNETGRMRVAKGAYNRAVAGVISGANGVRPGITLRQEGTVADGKLPVAGVGRVWAFCDADANGPIQAGDLLTTSDTPGYAMRVTDHARANGAVIGKAMSRLERGQGLVLVFVSLK